MIFSPLKTLLVSFFLLANSFISLQSVHPVASLVLFTCTMTYNDLLSFGSIGLVQNSVSLFFDRFIRFTPLYCESSTGLFSKRLLVFSQLYIIGAIQCLLHCLALFFDQFILFTLLCESSTGLFSKRLLFFSSFQSAPWSSCETSCQISDTFLCQRIF